eukprot:scaffold162744_cov16-Tisochrysis_lutea.AAC.1
MPAHIFLNSYFQPSSQLSKEREGKEGEGRVARRHLPHRSGNALRPGVGNTLAHAAKINPIVQPNPITQRCGAHTSLMPSMHIAVPHG